MAASRAVWIGGLAVGAFAVGAGVYLLTRKAPAAAASSTPPTTDKVSSSDPVTPTLTPQPQQTFAPQAQPPAGTMVQATPGKVPVYVPANGSLTIQIPAGATWEGMAILVGGNASNGGRLVSVPKTDDSVSLAAADIIGNVVMAAWTPAGGTKQYMYAQVQEQKVLHLRLHS